MDFHDFQQTWKHLEIITTEARDLLYVTCSTSYCLCNTLMDPLNMCACAHAGVCICVCVCVCVCLLSHTLSAPVPWQIWHTIPKTNHNHFLQNSFQFIFTIILSVGKCYQINIEIRIINPDNFQLRCVMGFWTQSRTENENATNLSVD